MKTYFSQIMQEERELHIFFGLLHRAVGNNSSLPDTISSKTWKIIYALSRKHAVTGVTYLAIEQLPIQQQPPKDLMLKWTVSTEYIKTYNKKLDEAIIVLAKQLKKEGFRSVILKGQGIAQLYPQPDYRTSGDIDVWIDGTREQLTNYARRFSPTSNPVYHHIDFVLPDKIKVEAHFTPSWMNEYVMNSRLQQYFRDNAEKQFTHHVNFCGTSDIVCTPTTDFNRIYILLHIYRHFFQHGIGLRQLLDYYYVLKQERTPEETSETLNVLKRLHLIKFTGAVMYVLQIVFGIDKQYMLVDANKKDGEVLLNEIIHAGNFGQYDDRTKHKRRHSTLFAIFLHNIRRNMRFACSYPLEALFSPTFKIWHYAWRKYNKWI